LAKNSNARYTKSSRIRGLSRPHFLLKFQKLLTNYLLDIVAAERSSAKRKQSFRFAATFKF